MKTSAPKSGLVLAVASLLAASGTAIAASPKLKGTYAEVGETGCLTSTTVVGGVPVPGPSGFNPVTLTPNGGSSLFMLSFHAIRTFDGEGSGTYQGRTAAINFSPSAGSSTDIVATFTYVVAPDGTISTEEDTVGTVLSGTRAGQTATNSFGMTSFSNGDVQQRICHRSRTMVRTSEYSGASANSRGASSRSAGGSRDGPPPRGRARRTPRAQGRSGRRRSRSRRRLRRGLRVAFSCPY